MWLRQEVLLFLRQIIKIYVQAIQFFLFRFSDDFQIFFELIEKKILYTEHVFLGEGYG